MDYVRPLFQDNSDTPNEDEEVAEGNLDIICLENSSEPRARKREGEPIELKIAESPKRRKLSPSIFSLVFHPVRSLYNLVMGVDSDKEYNNSTEEDDDVVVVDTLRSPGRGKFNFPQSPPIIDLSSDEDNNTKNQIENTIVLDDDDNEVTTMTLLSPEYRTPMGKLFSNDNTPRAPVEKIRKSATPNKSKFLDTVTLSEDSSEDEVEVIAEIQRTPKSVLQSAREDAVATMNEVIALTQCPRRMFSPTQSDSISINSNNDIRSISGSPGPDDSVSRQTTPKSFCLEPRVPGSNDRWNRSGYRQRKKTKPFNIQKIINTYVSDNQENDPMMISAIQLSARDAYRAKLAERETGKIYAPVYQKQKKIGKLKKTHIGNDYVLRAKNALKGLKLERESECSTTESALSSGELEQNESETSSVEVLSRSQSPSSASSSFASRAEDQVTDLMEKIREVDLKLGDHQTVYKRYQDEIESRRRREIELEETLRVTTLSRTATRGEIEERVRQKLELGGIRLPKPKPKPKDEFPELPAEANDLCQKVWVRSNPDEVFVEGFAAKITRKDLLTLSSLNWLNDEIINFYLQLICQRSTDDSSLPKVYACNTFFYTNLSTKGYASVKRWTRKVDIFSFDIILVPVHMHNNHWCLAAIDFTEKKIDYFDSLHGSNSACLNNLSDYLHMESQDKKKVPFNAEGWTLNTRKDCPEQLNGSDCGMFSLKCAEFISRRKDLVFTQKNMPYYRKRMVYEIINKKLM